MELEQRLNSEMMLKLQMEKSYPQSKQRPPSCPGTCANPKRQVHSAPVHPNTTSFYTELKSGENNYQQRCQFSKRERPNKEYED